MRALFQIDYNSAIVQELLNHELPVTQSVLPG